MTVTCAPEVVRGLSAACLQARSWPLPGSGATLDRWRSLADLAEQDLVLGRLVEAHADADAILQELTGRRTEPGTRYGVWAARAPGHVLELRQDRLFGSKAWCSGATLLTHALLDVDDQLVEVDLRQDEVTAEELTWADAGMRDTDTRVVRFDGAPARVVPGDYLGRIGFWSGAIGVAACWYGGTVPLIAPLAERVRERPSDVHAAAHLGALATQLSATRALLREAAEEVDAGRSTRTLALAVRAAVADTATEVARRVGRAVGPQPYAENPRHAQRLADLEVYVRQDHAERDLAVLGAESHTSSWSL